MSSARGAGASAVAPEATYGFADDDSPSADDVEVTAVTSHGWRVSDARLPVHDPMRLMAFIERRGDAFEVLQLGAGFEWHVFPSMDAAFGYVVESGPRVARSRMQPDLGRR